MPTRRTLLRSLAVAGTAGALAGCQDGGDGETTTADTPTETPTDTETQTDTQGGDSTPTDTEASATVAVREHPEYGDILVDGEGLTLYLFTPDGDLSSACTGGCLDAWPPLTVDGEPTAGDGVMGTLETFERENGTTQVAIDGTPLYYYQGDSDPGDAAGQGLNDAWYVLAPDGSAIGMPTATETATDADGGTQTATGTPTDSPTADSGSGSGPGY